MSTKFFNSTSPDIDAFGYVEQPAKKRWAKETGWTIVRTWKGPRANETSFLQTKGWNNLTGIEVEYDGDVTTVTLTLASESGDPYGDPNAAQKDPYFVGWTLSGNSIQSEISAHGGFGVYDPSSSYPNESLGHALHNQILRALKQWKSDVDNAVASKTYPKKLDGTDFKTWDYAKNIVDPAGNKWREGRARYLFLQQLNKNDHWETSQPVLRKVETLRSISSVKTGIDYVNRFFSWSALKVHEPTLATAIIVSVESLDAADSSFSFVWRKRMPTLEISNDGKRMVTQEWWAYEAYDALLYGKLITATGGALNVPRFPDYTVTDPFLDYQKESFYDRAI